MQQERTSIDAIEIRWQWLLMTLLIQNVKQKSNLNDLIDIYSNVQIIKCPDI